MLKSITASENLTTTTGVQNKKGHKTNNKRKERRKKLAKKWIERQREKHEKFMKNFSNKQLSDSLLALLARLKDTPLVQTQVPIRKQAQNFDPPNGQRGYINSKQHNLPRR